MTDVSNLSDAELQQLQDVIGGKVSDYSKLSDNVLATLAMGKTDTAGMLREGATHGAIGTLSAAGDTLAAAPPLMAEIGGWSADTPEAVLHQVKGPTSPIGDWFRKKAHELGWLGDPVNQPKNPSERLKFEAASGVGAAAPIVAPVALAAGTPVAAGLQGLLGLTAGGVGGFMGEGAAQRYPEHPDLARFTGNLVGNAATGLAGGLALKAPYVMSGSAQYGPRMGRYIDQGVTPASLGDVMEGPGRSALQQIQRWTSDKIGGAGVAEKAGEGWASGLRDRVNSLVKSFGGSPDVTATDAGAALQSGLDDWKLMQIGGKPQATNANPRQGPSIYDVTAGDAAAGVKGTHDASNSAMALSQLVSPGTVTAIQGELDPTLRAVFSNWMKQGGGGEISLDDLMKLRSKVGALKDAAEGNIGGYTQGTTESAALSKVYATMSDDIEKALSSRGGPGAVEAWKTGNQQYASTMDTLDTTLRGVIGAKSPELAYKAALAGAFDPKGGASTLQQIKTSLVTELGTDKGIGAWNAFRSRVINDLGMANPANPREWSPSQFFTQYNKLNDKAKDVLFGGPGSAELRRSLDSIAGKDGSIIGDAKVGNQFYNSSQTSGGNQGAEMVKALKDLAQEAAVGGAGYAASGGSGMAAVGTILGVPLTNYAFQKLLTSPTFMKFALATTPADLPKKVGLLTSAANSLPPDEQRAISEFVKAAGGQGAPGLTVEKAP